MVLKFYQGVSKNWDIDVPCSTTSLHRHVLNCHVDDVISIFKKITHKGLTISLNDNLDSHLNFILFNAPDLNGKRMMKFSSIFLLLGIINFSFLLIF